MGIIITIIVLPLKLLMDLLVENKSIDLDVLADGLSKISDYISDEEIEEYRSYIYSVWQADNQYITENALKLKSDYEAATGVEKQK